MEAHFSKDEILNAYLNVVPFGKNSSGQNIAGIEEATIGIFGKKNCGSYPPTGCLYCRPTSKSICLHPIHHHGKIKEGLLTWFETKEHRPFPDVPQRKYHKEGIHSSKEL
ncbi:transglycosylase domain-containing protein [Amylolactobacillus amylophilus]|uniref:transglycosylase domain-containing protein n=1 Tax=Amylolactobacillus amylophilus TaxID=1603 RepID=UPI0034E30004